MMRMLRMMRMMRIRGLVMVDNGERGDQDDTSHQKIHVIQDDRGGSMLMMIKLVEMSIIMLFIKLKWFGMLS